MPLINKLEKIIGQQRVEKLVNSKVHRFIVDATAMNLFSLIYVLNDKFVGDKDWGEAWSTRLAAAIGNTLTGRPYGIFRDYVLKKLKVRKDSHWLKKYLVETATFAVGQSPLYALYLAGGDMLPEVISGIANGNIEQILNSPQNINPDSIKDAVISLTLLAPALGRPQGWTYDRIREQCGLEAAYKK